MTDWTSARAWSRHGWRTHLGATTAGPLPAAPVPARPVPAGPVSARPVPAGPVPAGPVPAGGEGTIPGLAAASARRVPDRVAVSVDGQPVTHGQLDARARQSAAWLAARLVPGDRMLLAARSGLGFLRWYLGALRAGVVVVLANPGYTGAELEHLAADSGARLAVADPGPARRLATLDAGPPVVPADDEPAGRPRDAARPLPAPDDIALLAYTSGTTGRPKGVPLTHRQLAASIRGAMAAWGWTADDVLVHALPLFHQHGLGGVHATLIAGSTVHLRSRFDPADLIATVRDEGGTVLFGVPATYQALLDAAEGVVTGSADAGPAGTAPGAPLLQGLRLAVCGSAPLSPVLAARLPALLGQLPLIRYGTTESGLDVSHPLGAARAETVGLPLPGVECRIWSAGREAPPGADGEIQLRGPQVFSGYWHDAGATAAAFTPDGWFRTGDVGAVDPATGHLVIRGRTKEVIISGGLNVYPREVEIALERHPAVAEAAVAGLPHPRWGEQVTAWVVPRAGTALAGAGAGEAAVGPAGLEAELMAHARTLLAAYKCPKQVFTLDALPRNELGKLNRAALTGPPSPAPGLQGPPP
jgi:acyl-CoA synthetase (AMP-forming)/AMP-acid ligase II